MGLYDRDYMRDDEPAYRPVRATPWSPTVALLVALGAIYVAQAVAALTAGIPMSSFLGLAGDHVSDPIIRSFALSLSGIKAGHVWELLTFQFLHGSIFHIALNGMTLYSFGRFLEQQLGRTRFLLLYFISGTAGGLLQVLATWLLRQNPFVPVVGASAGISGLLGAFMLSYPDLRLIIFPIPFKIRAWTLLWIVLPLSLVGTIFPFGGIAHAAHLGGLLAGGAFIRWTWRTPRRSQATQGDTVELRRVAPSPREAAPPKDDYITSEVDPILDKIASQGIHSLTERERKILESARKRMNKR